MAADRPTGLPASEDPDGLSFFTGEGPHDSEPHVGQGHAPSVFGALSQDPLDRVFGDNPLVLDEELGTTELTATVDQVSVPEIRCLDEASPAWSREFILYGPPMVMEAPVAAAREPRAHFWNRRRHAADHSAPIEAGT